MARAARGWPPARRRRSRGDEASGGPPTARSRRRRARRDGASAGGIAARFHASASAAVSDSTSTTSSHVAPSTVRVSLVAGRVDQAKLAAHLVADAREPNAEAHGLFTGGGATGAAACATERLS